MGKFAAFGGANPLWTGADNTIDTAGVTTEQSFVYDAAGDRFAGKISRSTTDAYLAAPLTGGVLDLDDALSFETTLEFVSGTAGGVYIGWFDADASIRHKSSLGVFVQSDDGDLVIKPQVWTTSGRGAQFSGGHAISPLDTLPHTIAFVYDPEANGGEGTITITVDGVHVNSLNLPSGFRDAGSTFTHFGVRNLWWTTGSDITFRLTAIQYTDYESDLTVVDLTSDPGWIGSGNNTTFTDYSNLPNQNFGFVGTSLASWDGSDIGGFFVRKDPNGVKTYYAVPLSDTLSLDDYIEFRGYVCLEKQNVDSSVHIGYFREADQAGGPGGTWAPNILGLLIGGATNNGHGLRPFYSASRPPAWVTATSYVTGQIVRNSNNVVYSALSDHVSGALTEPGIGADWATVWTADSVIGAGLGTQIPVDKVKREFRVIYDPTIGSGRITVTFRGETNTVDLLEADRAFGGSFDRFGIWPQNLSGGGPMQIYFSHIEYTHQQAP